MTDKSHYLQRRFRILILGIPALLGLLLILLTYALGAEIGYVTSGLIPNVMMVIALGLFSLSGVGMLMYYLQIGFRRQDSTESELGSVTASYRQLANRIQRLDTKIAATDSHVQSKLLDLEEQLKLQETPRHDISEVEKTEYVNRLRRAIEQTATEQFLNDIREAVEEDRTTLELINELNSEYSTTTRRLQNELESLFRRGNVNLVIGIFVALLGMAILAYYVVTKGHSGGSALAFTEQFVPLISLVIAVEVLAYFFLRLYSNSLREIKYFQNELTNIEAKYLAVRLALLSNDKSSIGQVILLLTQTERNYVPEKEKARTAGQVARPTADKETIESFLQSLLKLVSRGS